jgi:hypothetical protein
MRRRLTVSLAALGVAALAAVSGCGAKTDAGGGGSAPGGTAEPGASASATQDSSGVQDANSAEVKAENFTADCMKGKGFRYIPHALNFGTDANKIADYAGMNFVLSPPDEVRKFRAKYGFGGYGRLVYPNDPAVAEPVDTPNPNNAIRAALDPAQQKAYDQALNGDYRKLKAGGKLPAGKVDQGCGGEASLKFYGTGPSKKEQQDNSREYAKFTGDPAVVKAAQKYGDCLKQKGYRVKDARPGWISQAMFTGWSDKVPQGKVSAAAARSGLTKEIKAALDDLDCSTDYATLARTKYAKAVRAGGGVG